MQSRNGARLLMRASLGAMSSLANSRRCGTSPFTPGICGDASLQATRLLGIIDELQVGIKNPEAVATPSVRDDAAFLYTLVGVTSVLAVLGGFLPGDWVCIPFVSSPI